jgi:glycosyltransferase involved in cell wall biosynthesis
MPKVSVIIPTYNRADLLPRAIQSVINQTYKDWELLIIDDGSTDNTKEIVEGFIKKDSRIKYFYEENSGAPGRPKNFGIQKSNGKYIAFLDSDDEWLPEKLERQISVFKLDDNIGLVSCEAFIADQDGNIVDRIRMDQVPVGGVLPEILLKDFMFSCSSIVIPKSVFEHIGLRDENPEIGIAEDREYELRIATNGYKFIVIHEPLFKYFVHGNNITRKGVGHSLHYAMAAYKYIHVFEHYGLDGICLTRMGTGYLKIGDVKNAKKYFKMALSKKHIGFKAVFGCILCYCGRIGAILFVQAAILWNYISYIIGKKKKWEKDLYSP